jgi:hypothetical protein
MSSIRRVFVYIVSFITLGIFAAGVRTLLFLLFDTAISSPSIAGRPGFTQQQLSLGLAMLIIGGPLWYFIWRNIQSHTRNNPPEIASIMRQLFLNLILVVTALLSLFAAQDFLKWLLAGVPRTSDGAAGLATLIVTVIIWYYHWRISEKEGQHSAGGMTLRRWYIYIVSGWGLVWLTVGLVQLIYAGTLSLAIWGSSLVPAPFWMVATQTSVAWIIVGGLWWAFHWFRLARGDVDSVLRQVYFYLLTIVGSSVAGLVAVVIGLYQTFRWALGFSGGAGNYFQFLGWVIPTIVAAAAVWSYHQRVAEEEAVQMQERRLSSKRIHLYIMSFLGLGTLIAGLVILLGILLDFLINALNPPITVQAGWWQIQLSLVLALLIVSAPLWFYYWNQIIRLSERGGVVEWRARSRRIYLYAIIAAAILGLAADLVNIIYQIMSGALTNNFGTNVLQNAKWSIQSLIVAAPLLVYHWRIAREDQRRGAEVAVARKDVTVLAGVEAQELVSRLEPKLGRKVKYWRHSGLAQPVPSFSDEEVIKLVSEIESSAGSRVMIVVHEGKVLVLPYEES